mmetsp:Transcript_65069/g.212083  ORF Transcript_65069/g.212083 Transcript_65069/m.212083 type:complete len:274 (+) Transcript_65069:554-1375(+)
MVIGITGGGRQAAIEGYGGSGALDHSPIHALPACEHSMVVCSMSGHSRASVAVDCSGGTAANERLSATRPCADYLSDGHTSVRRGSRLGRTCQRCLVAHRRVRVPVAGKPRAGLRPKWAPRGTADAEVLGPNLLDIKWLHADGHHEHVADVRDLGVGRGISDRCFLRTDPRSANLAQAATARQHVTGMQEPRWCRSSCCWCDCILGVSKDFWAHSAGDGTRGPARCILGTPRRGPLGRCCGRRADEGCVPLGTGLVELGVVLCEGPVSYRASD